MNLQKKIEKLIPHDKALHYLICNVAALVAIIVAYPLVGWWAVPIAFILCQIPIFWKEHRDRKTTGFDWVDILWGELGVLTMCLLAGVLIGI